MKRLVRKLKKDLKQINIIKTKTKKKRKKKKQKREKRKKKKKKTKCFGFLPLVKKKFMCQFLNGLMG